MDQDSALELDEEHFEECMFKAQQLGAFLPGKCPTSDSCEMNYTWHEEEGSIEGCDEEELEFWPKVCLYAPSTCKLLRASTPHFLHFSTFNSFPLTSVLPFSHILRSTIKMEDESEFVVEIKGLPASALALAGMTVTRECSKHELSEETFRTKKPHYMLV